MRGQNTPSPFPPPLPQNEKLQPYAEGKPGQTERQRDWEEGVGMRQDCFGFGATAAVSDVR